MATLESQLLDQAWTSLAGDAARPAVDIQGPSRQLPSRLAVDETAVACVATALAAAAALQARRRGGLLAPSVDRRHVAAAVRSERFFQRDGVATGMGFAPLSRFWRASDGWVRTHANYPWHLAALLAALEAADDPAAIAAAIAERPALDVEATVFGAGGIAAAVRTPDEWHSHPQGGAVTNEPLIAHRAIGLGDASVRGPSALPAQGVRVLDFTRVIAGPVCTRFLAALGAEVLRIDPPHRPDMARGHKADTLLGKRSAILDLRSRDGMATVRRLIAEADVVVCGYRGGALDHFELDELALAEQRPGLVVVYLDAWGHTGPWAHRRGFDSVVQAPTGIAATEEADGEAPGVLPCQLLDHGTGYLAAAAALDGLRRQVSAGGTHIRRVSLARTADWLLAARQEPVSTRSAHSPAGADEWLDVIADDDGVITAVRPPGAVRGKPLRWPRTQTGYGSAAAAWTHDTVH